MIVKEVVSWRMIVLAIIIVTLGICWYHTSGYNRYSSMEPIIHQ